MRNLLDARVDMDYEAYLVQVRPGTLDEAFNELDPHASDTEGDTRGSCAEAHSADYFVFYQDDGRWAWRRESAAEIVVAVSKGSFKFYLQCLADARQHGWKGRPVSLFSMSGFPPYLRPTPQEQR